MIRIAIVDDHPVFREGTAAMLEAEPDLTVVALVGDVDSALKAIAEAPVDVLVVDVRLPDGSGFGGLPEGSSGFYGISAEIFHRFADQIRRGTLRAPSKSLKITINRLLNMNRHSLHMSKHMPC
jgi:hypothetical protein